MASGNLLALFLPGNNEPPATAPATYDALTAASGARPVLDFDSASSEWAYWTETMPSNYAGGGVTATVWYAMDSANTGTKKVRWEAAFERTEDGVALGAAGNDFAATQGVSDTVDNTANNMEPATITFTNGAQMDSVVANDVYRFRLYRDHDHADDDATGDAQLIAVVLTET